MFKTLFKPANPADKPNTAAARRNPAVYRQHIERKRLNRRANLRRLRG